MNATFREILTTGYWNMDAEAFRYYKQLFLGSINSNTLLEFDKTTPLNEILGVGKSFDPQSKVYIGNSQRVNYYHELDESDHIVNIVNIQGPIVRGEGMCSYGSMYIRDSLIDAADVKQTRAHILKINSPGGCVDALKDFKISIEYCRSKNQPVYALIDGRAASLALEVAVLCDKIYFTNVEDEIGSVGTLWSTYTSKHGDVNTITQNRYAERYASKAVDKNIEYRQASDGNFDLIDKALDEHYEEFAQLVTSRRPKVKKDRLTGKMYKATEVLGEITDGQRTVMQIVDECLKPYGISLEPSGTIQNTASGAENISAVRNQTKNTNPQNKNMDLTKINAAMGLSVPVEQDTEGGVYLNSDQLNEFEAYLEAMTNSAEDTLSKLLEAEQTIERLTDEKGALLAKHSDLEQAKAEVDEANTNLKTQHQTDIDARSDAHAKEVEALDEKINTLEEQVSRLSNRSAIEEEAGGAPKSDTFTPTTESLSRPVPDSSKSATENRAAMLAYEKALVEKSKSNN